MVILSLVKDCFTLSDLTFLISPAHYIVSVGVSVLALSSFCSSETWGGEGRGRRRGENVSVFCVFGDLDFSGYCC